MNSDFDIRRFFKELYFGLWNTVEFQDLLYLIAQYKLGKTGFFKINKTAERGKAPEHYCT